MNIEFTVEFLTLAAREPESAAPVDLNVPIRLRGLETTRRLQAYPATARLPVTALAALSQGEVQQEPRDVGFAAFLSGPSASSTRLEAIRRLLPGAAA